MAGLTAVIITKNEASNIRRCLNSIADVVDEIVVVDSFSEDSTREICEEFLEWNLVIRVFMVR